MPISPVMPFRIIPLRGEATFAPEIAPVEVLPSGRIYIAAYNLTWHLLAVQPYPLQRSFFAPYGWSAQYELTVLLPQQESQFYLVCYKNEGVVFPKGPPAGPVIDSVGVGWNNPLPENTPSRRDFQFEFTS